MNRRFALSEPRWGLLLLALLWAAVGYGQAANPAPTKKDTATTAREYPYAMPELPALTFIDAGAAKIVRPVLPRALATELVNGIDSAGRVKQGLAIAIAPWALLGQRITLQQYQKDYGKYLAANTQVSLGTVRVAGNAAATDLGLGLRLTLLDGSDPMRAPEFTDSVRKMLLRSLPKNDEQDADVAEIDAALKFNADRVAKAQADAAAAQARLAAATGAAARAEAAQAAQAADNALLLAQAKLVKAQGDVITITRAAQAAQVAQKAANAQILKYRKKWRDDHWNATSFSVAAATGWRLNESKLAPAPDNRLQGWSAWATVGLPLGGKAGQLLAQGRYTYRRQVAAADAPTQADGQFQYGARAVFGSASLNFYLEATGTTHSNPLPGSDKARGDWAGGIEFRTTEGMWISTGLGHRLPSAGGTAEPALLFAGLRWQVASAPRLATPSR